MTTEFTQNFLTLTEDELVDVSGGAVVSAGVCVALVALSYTIGKRRHFYDFSALYRPHPFDRILHSG